MSRSASASWTTNSPILGILPRFCLGIRRHLDIIRVQGRRAWYSLDGSPGHFVYTFFRAAQSTPTIFTLGDPHVACQANTTRGPCPNPVKPGSQHCRQHTRDANLATAYRLSNPDLQESADYHAKASLVDISQQIVLMRSIVERRLNMAGDSTAEQISAFNFVATQLLALTKMTEILVKLSKESGELMQRGAVEAYTDAVLNIVIDEIKTLPNFEAVVDRIVAKLDSIEL